MTDTQKTSPELVHALNPEENENPEWLRCEECAFGLAHLSEETALEFAFCMAGPPPWFRVPLNAFCGRYTPRGHLCVNCAWWSPSDGIDGYQGDCWSKGPHEAVETAGDNYCASWVLRRDAYINKRGERC